MLERILDHLHNYFVVSGGVHAGEYVINSSALDVDFLQPGQYYRIVGSVFNDGVHKYKDMNEFLTDERFVGEIWAMAVPPAVVALSKDIKAWCEEHPVTGYASEAFGGYSYSLGTIGNTGVPVGWESVFRGRLNAWRKLP